MLHVIHVEVICATDQQTDDIGETLRRAITGISLTHGVSVALTIDHEEDEHAIPEVPS